MTSVKFGLMIQIAIVYLLSVSDDADLRTVRAWLMICSSWPTCPSCVTPPSWWEKRDSLFVESSPSWQLGAGTERERERERGERSREERGRERGYVYVANRREGELEQLIGMGVICCDDIWQKLESSNK